MLQHTRNNRRQTFDRISGSVFLHDVSDRVRPLFNGTGTVRAKLGHAFAEGGRTLGVDNQLLPMRLLDLLWEGAHDSTSRPRLPRHRRAVEANPARVRLACRVPCECSTHPRPWSSPTQCCSRSLSIS